MTQTGILLLNLGTPEFVDKKSVGRYLRKFLNDPLVIDLPWLVRKILINVIVIPFRVKKTTKAYQQIWTPAGSPLLVNNLALQQALAKKLGSEFTVSLGMRYSKPSILEAYNHLRNCGRIVVIPLFPQYSTAATGSTLANTLTVLSTQRNIPSLKIIHDFFDDVGFIKAYARNIQNVAQQTPHDFMLFSYHGLPERHLQKSGCRAICDKRQGCPTISSLNRFCYRAQCYTTSSLLAQELQLSPSQYCTVFQSRLGKTPWIKPYLDEELIKLRQQGIEKLIIACPSFVIDCLETLEEIGIRAKQQWQHLGGHELTLVPCLNDQQIWVEVLANWCQENRD